MHDRRQTSPSRHACSQPPARILPLVLALGASLTLSACGQERRTPNHEAPEGAGTNRSEGISQTGPGQQPHGPKQNNLNSKLQLDKSFYEFGKVLHGSKPSTSFKLRNKSQDKLKILGEKNSCSCAQIEHKILDAEGKPVDRRIYFPPRRENDGSTLLTWLMPGETLQLTVHVDTKKRDPIAKQENAETHLLFEDPEIGEVVVGYRFFIDPPILVDPSAGFRALPISKGSTGLESFELYPGLGKKPFKILRIEGPDALVKLTRIEAHRVGGHRFELAIGPFPPKDSNWMRDLWFHTDLPGNYKMHIVVGGAIVPDLEFLGPRGQSFGRFDFKEKKESRLRLRYNGKRDKPTFAIEELQMQTSDGKDVTSYFEASLEHQGGKRWDVVLRYSGGLSGRRFGGNYQLRSNVEGFEKTDIGVTGFRLDKP